MTSRLQRNQLTNAALKGGVCHTIPTPVNTTHRRVWIAPHPGRMDAAQLRAGASPPASAGNSLMGHLEKNGVNVFSFAGVSLKALTAEGSFVLAPTAAAADFDTGDRFEWRFVGTDAAATGDDVDTVIRYTRRP